MHFVNSTVCAECKLFKIKSLQYNHYGNVYNLIGGVPQTAYWWLDTM